jgi:O-antigen/teichoic acid export membrane protein
MIINRTKNTIWNILWGILNKIINIVLPFISRTVVIYILGSEYIGLSSLFTSILQVLNLAELGISSAIVFSMYKPIAEDDDEAICALMKLYKRLYKIIGCIILAIGIMLMPFLGHFIKGTYPGDVNLYILYLLYLINTVIGYFIFAYKSALLYAHQRNALISNINSIMCLLQNTAQIIILIIFKNYYLFILIIPICTIINNISIAIAVNKLYSQYSCKGTLSKETISNIVQKVKGLMISKVCNTTRNAFDSIFISSFIGLTAVAIYSNYYYIMASILSILTIITNSMIGGIGNSIVLDSVEKNYNDMRKFNFIYSWISGVFTVCLLCLYQPFMRLWVGESMMYPMHIVIAFCTYFYAMTLGGIRAVYHDAVGLWWEARYRAIIESILNLLLNWILTPLFGILGTIIGTLISLLIVNYGYGTKILFDYYFNEYKIKTFFLDHLRYTIFVIISCIIVYYCTIIVPGNNAISFILKAIICLVLPNIIFFVAYRKNNLYMQSKEFFLRFLEHKSL